MLIETFRWEPQYATHTTMGSPVVQNIFLGEKLVSNGMRCGYCKTKEDTYANSCPNCGAPY